MSTPFSAEQLTLGELIDAVKRCRLNRDCHDEAIRQGPPKHVGFDFGYLVPTKLASYRGFYDHLALGFADSGRHGQVEAPTAEAFLVMLNNALGETFEGWKGGNYRMSRETPMWVSNPGEAASTAVIGVHDDGYQLIIRTAWVDV